MKKLILIRHAKSSWKHNVIDHERPLNDRGASDVKLVAKHLIKEQFDPDLVLVSDATRTKLTAETFISTLNLDRKKVEYLHDLYDFSGYDLVRVIKACESTVDNLMVFGHNHAITSFVNTYGSKYIENVPTCGVVIMVYDIESWSDLKQGRTVKTVFPRDLK
ncbi:MULTISPECIES: histidine phosphatase family protein [Aestuariivivens]|uniref:SixA phosphatase family protein n=1 Tax=Aestuariivivens TaxID=1820275 RepID=UPI001CC17540|nr:MULTISPECIES: histidine phosphatase family protein [Aestuariivivens]